MNKANKNKVNDYLVALIEKIETKGILPWVKPWTTGKGGVNYPQNLITGHRYRGVNSLICSSMLSGFEYPLWATFNQVKNKGGYVKAGEKSTMIVYFTLLKIEEKEGTTEETKSKMIPILKLIPVFNIAQTSLPMPVVKEEVKGTEFTPIEQAEQVMTGYKNCPSIQHGAEDRAYYRVTEDKINMPQKESFKTAEHYYATLFHEAVHSTGANHRLNRKFGTRFGTHEYSQEELVAEFGSALLMAICGINKTTEDNSIAYLQNWYTALKKDPKMLVYGCSQGQKAADYIMGVKQEEEE